MRVNNLHVSSFGVNEPLETTRIDAPRPISSEPAPLDSSLHTRSPELTYWLALVGREPETRSDILDRVVQRLAAGHYRSAEAARLTAQAMLDAQD